MNDRHLLVAKIDDRRYVVREYDSYPEAVEAQMRLDHLLVFGKLAKPGVALQGHRPANVPQMYRLQRPDYLAVRSVDDPGWNRADRTQLVVLDSSAGSVDPKAAIRRIGERHGLHARSGGWVYTRSGSPVTQGWESWWHRSGWRHQGDILMTRTLVEAESDTRPTTTLETRFFTVKETIA